MKQEEDTDLTAYFDMEKLPLGYKFIQAIPLKDIKEFRSSDRFSTSALHFATLFQKETLYKPISDLTFNFSLTNEKQSKS
ncbi:hypothetical protein JKA74_09650 [Marivirga sp. S37H4]|uniref:Uncharacterized protein n=1 Tax=Marivirga aurantiaca TaxID=2802615 RepID=A0A934WY53_9BACT|nr:hypothetical protein [Marivirga aurantiaca]MBK6265304.1 hypothetical protein [Marivirga aurantiaca]